MSPSDVVQFIMEELGKVPNKELHAIIDIAVNKRSLHSAAYITGCSHECIRKRAIRGKKKISDALHQRLLEEKRKKQKPEQHHGWIPVRSLRSPFEL